MSQKIIARFTDGHELTIGGDAKYEIDYRTRVVKVVKDGFCSFLNFETMQYIHTEPESKGD